MFVDTSIAHKKSILSVVITIFGRHHSHFLLEYFTESKGITIAAGNCNFLHRQICKCELLLSSGNSKFRQKIFRRDSKTVQSEISDKSLCLRTTKSYPKVRPWVRFPARHRKSASLPGKPLSKKKIQY